MKTFSLKRSNNRLRVIFCLTLTTILPMTSITGCGGKNSGVGTTAAGGAVIGAGFGLLLGALTGNARAAAAGAAIGAGVGAGQGAYEGWKQDQDDKRTEEITQAIKELKSSQPEQNPNADANTRAREELTRFLGIWTLEGWAQEPGQDRLSVKARVNADIQMSYFVELAFIDLQVTGMDSQVWGTSTIGYDNQEGYNIVTRFNTSPEPLKATGGTWDQSSRTFNFKGVDSRSIIRFDTPDRFIIETYVPAGRNETQVEEYTCTRI